ncbi:MAG: hypothetical protein R2848_03310 [Thermomicrobiales bacterium]
MSDAEPVSTAVISDATIAGSIFEMEKTVDVLVGSTCRSAAPGKRPGAN